MCEEEQTDLLLIAGDLFHRQPLLRELKEADYLFASLSRTQVVLIAGNHDYIKKDSYYRTFAWSKNVHMILSGEISRVELKELDTAVYGLSYYTRERNEPLYERIRIQDGCRYHILLAHGGGEKHLPFRKAAVDAIGFDYVALGHLHGPQSVTRPTIRYCGTPLKYSFSEVRQKKSVTVVELAEKGSVVIRELPLKPLRDLVELRGTYEEVSSRAFYMGTHWQEDYVHIILTDENDIPDAVAKLRTIYHGLMKLDYDNQRTRNALVLDAPDTPERTDPMDLLSDFYEQQNGQPMSDEQRAYIKELMERVREELQ